MTGDVEVRDVDDAEFLVEDAVAPVEAEERETDPRRLEQRQKQVDLGKNTLGYQRYRAAVPRAARGRRAPWTPDVGLKCSKRAFDGQVRKWRRQLHEWDAAQGGEGGAEAEAGAEAAAAAAAAPAPSSAPASPSKNGLPPRQRALPLKIPSAMRPAKRPLAAGAPAAGAPPAAATAWDASMPDARDGKRSRQASPARGPPPSGSADADEGIAMLELEEDAVFDDYLPVDLPAI